MKNKVLIIGIFQLIFLTYANAELLQLTGFGKLFVSNFSPGIYRAGNQNWDICEGENGLMYFANGPLLEGGSNYWERHYLPPDNYLRSVHRIKGNRILVGANHEIGIFSRLDIPGEVKYESLLDKLDKRYHDFGSIWQILEHDNAFYLRGGRALFKYENDTIVPLLFGDVIDYINFIGNDLYVLLSGKGLGKYNSSGFQILPSGDFFADKTIVRIIAQPGLVNFLVFTDDEGVYLVDEYNVKPYETLNIQAVIESQINDVLLLDNKYFAVGTVKNGLYIIDQGGNIIQHLNKKNGLQNNTVICMYADQTNNLWLGLDYGISYVYLNSCLSIINSEADVGTGYVSCQYGDKLYLGTNQGLYFMNWEDKNEKDLGDMRIYPVKNTSGQVWDLSVIDNQLYCNHHKGLFRIKDNAAELISPLEGSWQFEKLNSIPGIFLQSTYRGYYLYRLNNKGIPELVKKIDEFEFSRLFSQDNYGFIWNVTPDNRLFRYRLDADSLKIVEKKEYSGENDFVFTKIRIVGNNDQLIFTTDKGLFTWNPRSDKFENKYYYEEILNVGDLLIEFFEDDYDRIWYVTGTEIGYFSLHFGQMKKVSRPFNLVSSSYTHIFGKINVIDHDNILFGVDRGFYHYNAACTPGNYKDYHAYIVDLKTYSPPIKMSVRKTGKPHPVYSHKKNSFEFLFTSNIVENKENIQFKYKLDGYNENWSDWTTRNLKEYNNLMEGYYTLRVKAREISGTESSEAHFTFQVKPPPYRSVVAFFIYLVIFVAITLILRRYRRKKLENEKKKIEIRKQLEMEEKKKKYEEEQINSRQKITELINEKLQQDLKHKSKELSNSMINILHKNEILLNLKQEMQILYLEKNLDIRDDSIKKLIRMIENEITTKKDLEVFDSNFNAVHEEFIKNIKIKYPSLTQNDHRLCTFIKMNKSTKEIATFLNMSIRGVETSRYRLRKKMKLDSDENLYDVISGL